MFVKSKTKRNKIKAISPKFSYIGTKQQFKTKSSFSSTKYRIHTSKVCVSASIEHFI